MGLVVVSLLVSLVLGAVLGGSVSRLATLPFRGWRLLIGAATAQLISSMTSGWAYAVSAAVSAALALGFLGRNRRLPGLALVAGGLLLNAGVIAANGAMPVSENAAAAAGIDLEAITAGADPRHELAGGGTWLPWLGDVLPVRLPIRPEVASPGDATVAVGLALLVVTGMRRAPVRYRPGLLAAGQRMPAGDRAAGVSSRGR